MKRRILITGGAGNIGGSLAKRLVADEANFVVILDNLVSGSLSKLPSSTFRNWEFIKCDVNNSSELLNALHLQEFDFVFHYAALVGVKRTTENPLLVLEDIKGIQNVLNLAKNSGVRRAFYSSSSEVYGESISFPQNEKTTPLNSRLPYAVVKNVGEAFFRSYHKEYGLPYTVFRFFNTYGEDQSDDFVIPQFIHSAMKSEPILIYGDGKQTRTYCYIRDNIDATIEILYNDLGTNEIINIGHDAEHSVLELAKLIIKLTNSGSRIVHVDPLDEGDMQRRKPDLQKMMGILKRPLTSLDFGLRKILECYATIQAGTFVN